MIVQFICRAILLGVPLLYGSTGEILTEKSGHLNLGIPGIMYTGAISGVVGAFLYENACGNDVANMSPFLAIIIPFMCAIIGAALMGLIYSFLTVTLHANQNVTGLALTTLGIGLGNFLGASLINITKSELPSIALTNTSKFFSAKLPFADDLGVVGELLLSHDFLTYLAIIIAFFGIGLGNFLGAFLINITKSELPSIALTNASKFFSAKLPFADDLDVVGELLLSHDFLTYLAIIIALIMGYVLNHTRLGLNLRSVGENPATADAAGINVSRYRYVSTCIGSAIAGLGGLQYVMAYASGVWSNNAFGDRGWMAIALVIFALWKPSVAILGSFVFGALCNANNYIQGLGTETQELFKMLPYVVTIIVLIITSMRKKREHQPPASLGLSYFREER